MIGWNTRRKYVLLTLLSVGLAPLLTIAATSALPGLIHEVLLTVALSIAAGIAWFGFASWRIYSRANRIIALQNRQLDLLLSEHAEFRNHREKQLRLVDQTIARMEGTLRKEIKNEAHSSMERLVIALERDRKGLVERVEFLGRSLEKAADRITHVTDELRASTAEDRVEILARLTHETHQLDQILAEIAVGKAPEAASASQQSKPRQPVDI